MHPTHVVQRDRQVPQHRRLIPQLRPERPARVQARRERRPRLGQAAEPSQRRPRRGQPLCPQGWLGIRRLGQPLQRPLGVGQRAVRPPGRHPGHGRRDRRLCRLRGAALRVGPRRHPGRELGVGPVRVETEVALDAHGRASLRGGPRRRRDVERDRSHRPEIGRLRGGVGLPRGRPGEHQATRGGPLQPLPALVEPGMQRAPGLTRLGMGAVAADPHAPRRARVQQLGQRRCDVRSRVDLQRPQPPTSTVDPHRPPLQLPQRRRVIGVHPSNPPPPRPLEVVTERLPRGLAPRAEGELLHGSTGSRARAARTASTTSGWTPNHSAPFRQVMTRRLSK